MKEELSSFHIDQGQQQRVWFESNLELVNTEIKIPLIVANNLSFWFFFSFTVLYISIKCRIALM